VRGRGFFRPVNRRRSDRARKGQEDMEGEYLFVGFGKIPLLEQNVCFRKSCKLRKQKAS
jgi:hypothetical protein